MYILYHCQREIIAVALFLELHLLVLHGTLLVSMSMLIHNEVFQLVTVVLCMAIQ